jgi:hypothetical protein
MYHLILVLMKESSMNLNLHNIEIWFRRYSSKHLSFLLHNLLFVSVFFNCNENTVVLFFQSGAPKLYMEIWSSEVVCKMLKTMQPAFGLKLSDILYVN